MRSHLVGAMSLACIGAAACGGGTGSSTTGGVSTTASSSAGSGTTTAGTSGSSSTGSTSAGSSSSGSTTGTSTGGGLADGQPCTSNAACVSNVCGIDGTGTCCHAACATSDATCRATACDGTGACTYPASTVSCGTSTCAAGQLTASACNGAGACTPGTPTPCPNGLACNSAGTGCLAACFVITDCASGFYCDTTTSLCVAQQAIGPCSSNDVCASGVCGLAGTGNCCTAACAHSTDPTCAASGCDATTGACNYPSGTVCGVNCSGSTLSNGACNDNGACIVDAGPCTNNFSCADGGTTCLTSCTTIADCASGFYCSGGMCLAQVATGPCSTNDACTSGICGINGSGHCCSSACVSGDPTCGATDCDGTGACIYPPATTACGTVGCSGAIISSATTCDGMGTCTPNFVDCSPYACRATSCLTSCTASGGCGPGYLCDTTSSTCCGPGPNGTLNVDSVLGDDTVVCCGTGTNTACQTLTHAMSEVDTAQAKNVTLAVTVDGGGGDWAPTAEVYPIVLGWGVELSAPGVFFLDPNTQPSGPPNTAILDINYYSTNDTVGYVSIVGAAGNVVGVGMNAASTAQTDDSATIQVEASNTLYIANANVNGSFDNQDSLWAINVLPGATLTLGQDKSSGVTGTVTIGNNLAQEATDGYQGIGCQTDGGIGCTITDAPLVGQSSVVIQGQENLDIDAEDSASISLSSSPIIGVAPSAAGFNKCPAKPDLASTQNAAAIYVNGSATISLKNATLQCIAGRGIATFVSASGGTATVTIDSSTIQNTDVGIYAPSGTVTVTNSTLNYNFMGVWQQADVTYNGAIDLSGGGNTVICSSNKESSTKSTNPGIDVYNSSTAVLKADNVSWDTPGPDYFDCLGDFSTCTCNLDAGCTTAAGANDMDAVEDSTNLGGITTTGNTLAVNACN